MERTKDNKIIKGIVFTAIRTVMEIISAAFFAVSYRIQNDGLMVALWIIGLFVYLALSVVPHIFVRNTTLGLATIYNTISTILFSGIAFVIIVIFTNFSNYDGSVGGWVVIVGVVVIMILAAIYFAMNFIADLIVHFAFIKRKMKNS